MNETAPATQAADAAARAQPRMTRASPAAAEAFDAALARRGGPMAFDLAPDRAPVGEPAAEASGEPATDGASRDPDVATTLWRRLFSARLAAASGEDAAPAAAPMAAPDGATAPPLLLPQPGAAPPACVDRKEASPSEPRRSDVAPAPAFGARGGAPAPDTLEREASPGASRPRVDVDAAAPAPSLAGALATNVAPVVETHLPPARWPQAIAAIGEGAGALRAALAAPSEEAATPAAARVGVLRLALDPERLGAVSVTLRLRGGELEARIVAQTGETAALIEQRRGELTDALRKAGYEVGALHVAQAATDAAPVRTSEQREQNHAGRSHEDQRPQRDGAAADEQRRPAPRQGREGEPRPRRDAPVRAAAGFEPG